MPKDRKKSAIDNLDSEEQENLFLGALDARLTLAAQQDQDRAAKRLAALHEEIATAIRREAPCAGPSSE
ncbi:MAG: hypothetical protein ACYCP0_08350 [Acidiferrobacteraceae bacterium]